MLGFENVSTIFDSITYAHFNSVTLQNVPIIEIVWVERVLGVVGDPSYHRHFAIRAKIELHSTLRNYNAHAYYASRVSYIYVFSIFLYIWGEWSQNSLFSSLDENHKQPR